MFMNIPSPQYFSVYSRFTQEPVLLGEPIASLKEYPPSNISLLLLAGMNMSF